VLASDLIKALEEIAPRWPPHPRWLAPRV